MTPPHNQRPASDPAIVPIRPVTTDEVLRAVEVETRIVRDVQALVGSVLIRMTETKDSAAAARRACEAMAGDVARIEAEVEMLRADLGGGLADVSAAIIRRDAADAHRDRQLAAAKGVVGTSGAGAVLYALVEIVKLLGG